MKKNNTKGDNFTVTLMNRVQDIMRNKILSKLFSFLAVWSALQQPPVLFKRMQGEQTWASVANPLRRHGTTVGTLLEACPCQVRGSWPEVNVEWLGESHTLLRISLSDTFQSLYDQIHLTSPPRSLALRGHKGWLFVMLPRKAAAE